LPAAAAPGLNESRSELRGSPRESAVSELGSKPKRRWGKKSLRFQNIGKAWEQGTLSLPKLGVLKLAESLPRVAGEAEDRPFVEIPDMVTLSRDAVGRYHVSFKVVTEVAPLPTTGRTCGVDLGITNLATIAWNDGTVETVEAPKHYFARRRESEGGQGRGPGCGTAREQPA
jgi:transposase